MIGLILIKKFKLNSYQTFDDGIYTIKANINPASDTRIITVAVSEKKVWATLHISVRNRFGA